MSNQEIADEMVDGGITEAEAEAMKADETDASDEAVDKTEQKTEGSQVEASKIFFEYDGHKFQSQAELGAYLSGLEKALGRQGNEVGTLRKENEQLKNEPPVQYVQDDTLLDEIANSVHEDPKKAASLIGKLVDQKVTKVIESRDNTRNFWDNFFKQNPHLDSHRKRVVDYTYNTLMQELGSIKNVDEQFKLIKNEWENLTGIDAISDAGSENSKSLPRKKTVSPQSGKGVGIPKTTASSKSDKTEPETPVDIRKRLGYFSNDI